jgi:ceramide glucosyltransferase
MKIAWILLLPAISGVLCAILAWHGRRLSRAHPRSLPRSAPGVSILKPLKGLDPGLEENLATFFRLDHPEYEVLLGAADPADPALEVAARVSAAHPRVRCRIVSGDESIAAGNAPLGNPKVENLARLLRHARHDLLWISDSNTAVDPTHLDDMVARLMEPGVGLVSSPIAATGGSGPGAALESLQLHTFVRGGVGALHALGGVCVVGKSMLLHRRDLALIGGFRTLRTFVAEDQICGEEIQRRGLRCTLGAHPVRNGLGRLSIAEFAARHLRWARLRRSVCPAGYAGEVLLQPVALALAVALFLPLPLAVTALLGALLLRMGLDLVSDRAAGLRRKATHYLVLSPTRDLLVAALWVVPWVSGSTLRWRGHTIRIGPRTRIVGLEDPEVAVPSVVPSAPRQAPV